MNILIVYASKYGCSEKCAQRLSGMLLGKVDMIDLKKTNAIDISSYGKIVIGGSIYIGQIQKEVTEFCTVNLEKLKEKHVGLFVCGMQGEVSTSTFDQYYSPDLRCKSVAMEHFGGEFKFEKMKFLEKFIVKKVSKVKTNQSNISEENIRNLAKAMNAV